MGACGAAPRVLDGAIGVSAACTGDLVESALARLIEIAARADGRGEWDAAGEPSLSILRGSIADVGMPLARTLIAREHHNADSAELVLAQCSPDIDPRVFRRADDVRGEGSARGLVSHAHRR